MGQIKLLVVDDDSDIREMIGTYFKMAGFLVTLAANGEEGLKLAKENDYHIIILDLMMPKMDGYSMLEKLREVKNTPVILLTAKGDQISKIKGFTKGCDDYIVKPFDFTELSLRIQAILKRANNLGIQEKSNILTVKDLEIDIEGHCVKKNGIELELTLKEYEILYLLASNKGKVYSTKMIYELIWKEPFLENDNSVTAHIRNLRDKIGDKVKDYRYIKTIWGAGYKIEK